MSCRNIALLLGPFADGELGPEKVLEVEQHVAECALCVGRLRLGSAMRTSLRRVVREGSEPSAAFQERLSQALEATHEREREARVLERHAEKSRMLSWRTILPMAAAAALVLVWGGSNPPKQARWSEQREMPISQAGIDQMFDDLIAHHEGGRPEITEPTLLPRFESEVGVPVTIPNFAQYGGRWEGGSLVRLMRTDDGVVRSQGQRAASLRYKLSGHRLTLYVYDASRFPVGKIEERLQQRVVGDQSVYVGTRGRYSIGTTGRGRVGYALASDFNDRETAELVAAIF